MTTPSRLPEGARYLGSAGLSALLSNAILIGGDRAGLHYLALVLLSWAVTGTFAYALHVRFTFRQTARGGSYLRFMLGAAIGIPVAAAFLALLVSGLYLLMWLAAPVATVLMFVYNYLNARFAIVRWPGQQAG